jgi:hypothetical protein
VVTARRWRWYLLHLSTRKPDRNRSRDCDLQRANRDSTRGDGTAGPPWRYADVAAFRRGGDDRSDQEGLADPAFCPDSAGSYRGAGIFAETATHHSMGDLTALLKPAMPPHAGRSVSAVRRAGCRRPHAGAFPRRKPRRHRAAFIPTADMRLEPLPGSPQLSS